MTLNIHHSTIYRYISPIYRSVQVLRMTPRSNSRQQVLKWDLEMPGKTFINLDAFGNLNHCLCLPEPRTEIAITALGQVKVADSLGDSDPGFLPLSYFLRQTHLTQIDFEIFKFTESYRYQCKRETFTGLEQMRCDLLERIPYVRGMTHSGTTARDAFAIGAGVCQDHTHLFLSMARELGFPARYVSGYLHTDGQSHFASHAWAEVWIEDAWYGFDVSNDQGLSPNHVQVAFGLDYADACPIRGSRSGGGEERLFVFAQVHNQ